MSINRIFEAYWCSIKRCVLSLLLLLFFFSSCKTTKENTPESYIYLKGQIGSYPITMHMHIDGPVYEGVYWYDKVGKPIEFSGTDTAASGMIILNNYFESISEEISLKRTGDTFQGNWISEKNNSKTLAVELKKIEPKISFTLYEMDSTYVNPFSSDKSCDFSISMLWPTTKDKLSMMLIDSIKKNIDQSPGMPSDPKYFLETSRNNYINNYVNAIGEMKEDPDMMYSNSYSFKSRVFNQSDKILSLVEYVYVYDGGAHGYSGTLFLNFDFDKNRQLKLKDVFTPDGIRSLPRQIEITLRRQMKIPSYAPITDAGLFEEGIQEATENFYITPTGIGFVYNPYEIGPYASGKFDIFLDFKSIDNKLDPSFKSMIYPKK